MTHHQHAHVHSDDCGHTRIAHDDHTDYLHDGHLHHVRDEQVHEHELAGGADNPQGCTPGHACAGHDPDHRHAEGCGHEPVPHAGHVDHLVDGHLHHQHEDHCDDHGAVSVV